MDKIVSEQCFTCISIEAIRHIHLSLLPTAICEQKLSGMNPRHEIWSGGGLQSLPSFSIVFSPLFGVDNVSMVSYSNIGSDSHCILPFLSTLCCKCVAVGGINGPYSKAT